MRPQLVKENQMAAEKLPFSIADMVMLQIAYGTFPCKARSKPAVYFLMNDPEPAPTETEVKPIDRNNPWMQETITEKPID